MPAASHRMVRSEGSARSWIVMLHGATQHSGLFSAQEACFRRSHHLLLVDLPGHGKSTHLPGPYGLVEYARSVAEAIDEAGIDSAHLWGTHTGAAVGLLLAAEDPRRFRSLVLEGAVLPGLDMPYVAETIRRASETAHRRGLVEARREWFETAAFFDAIRADPIACRAAAHRAMIEEFSGGPWTGGAPSPAPDLTGRLAALSIPTLLINGERDVGDFLATAEFVAQRLPSVRRETVPGAGAFPLWERPELVNPLVQKWLDRTDRELPSEPPSR
jgi:pimeloyl-ACP methyl ester carboxylesterase